MKRFALLILAVFTLASCGTDSGRETTFAIERLYQSGSTTIRLKLSRQQITVADRLLLVLEAEAEEGQEVRFPEPDEKLGEFTIVSTRDSGPELAEGSRVVTRRQYTLEPFLPGDYEIPALEVQAGEEAPVRTEPQKVRVESVLPEATEVPDIKEIAPPVDLPGFSPWVYAAVLAVLAAAGLWIWYRRRQPQSAGVAPPPPHEIALRELRKLLDEDLIGKGEAKLFYLRVSAILRRYIEGRFGLQAPERTTEEFLYDLRSDRTLNDRQKDLLKQFLQHCDMVKFAEYQPIKEEIENTINTCAQFIAETKPAKEEAETVTASGGAAKGGGR